MTCERIAGRLSAFIDEQLPIWEKALVAEHTRNCLPCQAEIASLLSVKISVRSEPRPGLPKNRADRIHAETIDRAIQRSPSKIWWLPVLTATAVAAGWLALEHLAEPARSIPIQQAEH